MAKTPKDDKLGESLVKEDVITQEELQEARKREETSGVPLYRQFLQMGRVSAGALEDLLRKEFHPKAQHEKGKNLGKTLLEMGALTDEQLNDALRIQKRTGRLLGKILEDGGLVDGRSMALALAKQHSLEFVDFETTPSHRDALDAIPENIARKYLMIPVSIEGDKIRVLIDNPSQTEALNNAGIILHKRIQPMITHVDNIRDAIAARYGGEGSGGKKKSVEKAKAKPEPPPKKSKSEKRGGKREERKKRNAAEDTTVAKESEDKGVVQESARFDAIAKEASGVPVVKLVNTIIQGAINAGATDIHLDPQDPELRVRYRIDGILHDVMSIPNDTESAVVSRIKILSDIDITETRHPQDGHISMESGDDEFDIRVATLPTYLGERVVLRLLDQSSVLQGVRDLGLDEADEKKILQFVAEPYGMILVTGPTGSGKTTSLYAALNQKNVMTESIVTLEDPVEYQLSGINQVSIDNDIDLTFANTLRAALRQDIDVLLVGEIRDAETARIAIRASMTGHLVFSTLHTNDAPEAISTLRNMGVPAFLIQSALTAVIGQRLVRRICEDCKKSFKPTRALLKSVGLPESVKTLWRGEGCDLCYNTGNKGRTGIFEILEITPKVRDLIGKEASPQEISKAAKLKTMADKCRMKVREGTTNTDEFLRVIRT
jgi:type IV pilus assembly protein PilB